MLGGQGTSGRRHASSRRDQSGGTQTGLRNLQMYVIVALFDTVVSPPFLVVAWVCRKCEEGLLCIC